MSDITGAASVIRIVRLKDHAGRDHTTKTIKTGLGVYFSRPYGNRLRAHRFAHQMIDVIDEGLMHKMTIFESEPKEGRDY